MPDRVAVPDADHQQFGVVAFHRLQQLLGGVDSDRLGELEFHPAVREPVLDVVHLAGLREPVVDIGVARGRVDDPQRAAAEFGFGDAVLERRAAERVRAVSDHDHELCRLLLLVPVVLDDQERLLAAVHQPSTSGISSSAAIST